MASITAEEVKESLSIFNMEADVDALNKMLEIAGHFNYDADSIVNEWLAYQSTHECTLNIENLDSLLLEKTVGRNRGKTKTPCSNRKRKPVGAYSAENIDNFMYDYIIDEEEDDLLTAYGTSNRVQTKIKRSANITPRSIKSTARLSSAAVFSPSTLSPSTPSSRQYGSRSNRGETVTSYGISSSAISTHRSHGRPVSVFVTRSRNMNQAYKYMFQKLVDISDVLDDAITRMAERISKQYPGEIEEFVPCAMVFQEPVFIVGRISCDQGGGVGRLNSQSVILQGDRTISCGKSVHIDLSNMEEYSLFPGQIMIMQGSNPTGNKFIPTKIYHAHCDRTQKESPRKKVSDVLSVLIAAGPFTTSGCLSYEPLNDLLGLVKSTQPDVTVLIGPIVDHKHDNVRSERFNVPYEDFLQDKLNFIIDALKGTTHLIFVPSIREAGCHPVYPQPPYHVAVRSKNIDFIGDPGVLEIEGVNIAVTSNDILFHLGAEEISKVKGTSDRLGRLAGHLLQQGSFYPLYPSNESVSVDWIAAERFGGIHGWPDIAILPSDLKCFVKLIEGCVCINPGRLVKGLIGGTYAQVLIEAPDSEGSVGEISVQITKI